MAQYDAPISQAEFAASLEASSLSTSTKATITQLIAPLGNEIEVQTWDGQAALDQPNDVLVVSPVAAEGETVQLTLPADQLNSVKAWIFDTDANISATFNTIDRVIVGGRGENTFKVGGDHDTTIVGGNAKDIFVTSGGDDTFEVGTGTTAIDAGAGFDVVVAKGEIADYDVAIVGGALVLTTKATGASVESTSIFAHGVEFVEFEATRDAALADQKTIALTQDADAATVVRLYDGLLARNADVDGAKFWLGAEEAGVSADVIANAIISSAEFTDAHGDLSNGDFVELLFAQALQRDPLDSDLAGKAFWFNALEAGATRGQVAVGIIGSDEAAGLTADHIFTINDGTV